MFDEVKLTRILEDMGSEFVQVIGDTDRIVKRPAPIHEAGADSEITFCNRSGEEGLKLIRATRAWVVVCLPIDGLVDTGKTLLVTETPRLTFVRIVQQYFAPPRPQGIHPTAVIEPTARIHPTAYVGPFTVVGADCEIGANTVIYGHVYLYAGMRIGRSVIIHAGTVIGADGFGYERNMEGDFEKFPHVGGVIIEDEVEIGSNTSIDRGTLGNTIIRKGAKIDNLVHIAHNVVVGRSAVVIAHAMIGGSTVIGDHAWVAPTASVRDKLTLGEHSMVGLGAVVVRNVPDSTTVMGNPAYTQEDFKQMLAALKKLAGIE